MAAPSPPAMPALHDTLGAAFIGNLAAAILYGITILQTYRYYRMNGGDPVYMRVSIAVLWLLDTTHLSLITHGMYFYMVENFGNASKLLRPTWSLVAQVLVTTVSDTIVRALFGLRTWRLSGKNVYLAVTLATSFLVVVVGGIAFSIKAIEAKSYASFQDFSWLIYATFVGSVVADVALASSLCVMLFKSRTGFQRTDSLVHVLVIFAINTGLLACLCSIATLVAYALSPDSFIFIGIYFCMNKVFLNSLLATLNARASLREAGAVQSFPLRGVRGDTSAQSDLSRGPETPLAISVETTTHQKVDTFGDYDDRQWSLAQRSAYSPDMKV